MKVQSTEARIEEIREDRMKFKDYDNFVKEYPKKYFYVHEYVLKMTEELGEIAEIINKDGVNFNTKERLVEELGDVLFQLSAIAELINTDLSAIASWNIKKLEGRLKV